MFFSCPESLLSTQVEFERTQQAELRGERPGRPVRGRRHGVR